MKITDTIFLITIIFLNLISAQSLKLNAKEKSQVIDSTCSFIFENFIDENIAEEMAKKLRDYYENKRYENIKSHSDFATQITSDMREICNDKHFALMYNPAAIKQSKKSGENEFLNQLMAESRINFGFENTEILPGNVGYLKLNRFPFPTDAGDKAASALTLLSDTDALIIDLRDNIGGYNEMVQFLMSPFFEDRIHINTLYDRVSGIKKQFWTHTYTHGKMMTKVPIYIVTSRRTFSAAEWFTYSMKNNNRAMVIGETTRGGATPTGFFTVNDNFLLSVPNTSCLCPISKTNFNNIGIKPDSLCSRQDAVDIAHKIALEKLEISETNNQIKSEYKWQIDILSAKYSPVNISKSSLSKYVGKYDERIITLENSNLYYQLTGRVKLKLIPINKTDFLVGDIKQFRLRFVFKDGLAFAIKGLYSNGTSDISERSN